MDDSDLDYACPLSEWADFFDVGDRITKLLSRWVHGRRFRNIVQRARKALRCGFPIAHFNAARVPVQAGCRERVSAACVLVGLCDRQKRLGVLAPTSSLEDDSEGESSDSEESEDTEPMSSEEEEEEPPRRRSKSRQRGRSAPRRTAKEKKPKGRSQKMMPVQRVGIEGQDS